ncbi:AT-hook motif nuclear-localized protein 1, partial [Cucurbita argyrosperma subsp. sororia]
MEGRDGGASSGVTVVGSDAPSKYQIAPRTSDSPPQSGGSTLPPATQQTSTPSASAQVPAQPTAPTGPSSVPGKKKRGRPRKYGPDGSVNMALSPKPISSSVPPPVIDFSAEKRGKVRPASGVNKTKFEVDNLGDWVVPCSVGANFTPHIITVDAGEDVTMKIISFSQQGPRAICVLSANGVISSVTLRQPDSSGGTLTYEGRFEILSLSGSFMPSDNGGTRSRSGGMSVSLASPDGRVVGGGVAGLLVAASPVQVVVGSFLSGNQHEQKPKKPKQDTNSTAPPTAAIPISCVDPKANLSPSSPFRGDNWSTLPTDSRNNKPTDINVSLPSA